LNVNVLPFAIYVVAAVVYSVHFARRAPAVGRAATTILLLGALAHTFVIGMQTMEVRHVPVSNESWAISSFVWLLALSYLYLELATEERAMGVFILPVAIGLQAFPVLRPGVETADPLLDSPLFWVHIASLMFAYATFAIAAVLGLTYMLQFTEIKKKHLGYLYTRLPSLHVLDAMNSRAVWVGWTCLTLGLAVGVFWAGQARALTPDNANLQAMSLGDPKVFIAVLTWVLYSFSLVARRILGWHGRRAAWLSAVGFAIVLLNFPLVSYFIPNSHRF
jgi:ABC-type transport system involved in cytochrome c biogenesis permease subunit